MNNTPLYIYNTFCLFTHHLHCFYLSAVFVNKAAMNMGVQKSLWNPAFNAFGYILRSGIARLYGNSLTIFGNSVSHSGCSSNLLEFQLSCQHLLWSVFLDFSHSNRCVLVSFWVIDFYCISSHWIIFIAFWFQKSNITWNMMGVGGESNQLTGHMPKFALMRIN